jgi:hypothetical protein
MPQAVVWVHGTSVSTFTNSDVNYDNRAASGAVLSAVPGKNAWVHASIPIAIPTSSLVTVSAVHVLFKVVMGTLREVDIYDGDTLVHKFDLLVPAGDYRHKLTKANTFTLPGPHVLVSGLGVSVRFTAGHNMGDGPDPRFDVAAVGALISSPAFSVLSLISAVRRSVAASATRFLDAAQRRF